MLRRFALLPLAVLLALLWAQAAVAFTKTDSTVTMDDGVTLATTLYLPEGEPPAAGWPGIMMLHGLGLDRQSVNVLAQTFFVPQGYAVYTFDARAHGGSGGLVTIAGPREIADVRALFERFAARPDVADGRIGVWGISYGGGEAWRALVDGVPFAAVETVETWTDLYGALFPQNLGKSGVIAYFLNEIPAGRLAPEYSFLPGDALGNRNLDRLRSLAADRSSLALLDRVTAPVFMLQGRRDFAFGLEQATLAFRRLRSPKRLYVGLHGHAPSSFPAADTTYAMTQGRLWFDRFLKGLPNGIDTGPPVEVAPDPWRGKAVSYPGLPPTRALRFPLRGGGAIARSGKAVRAAAGATARLDTFGAPVVTVSATASGGWSRLVAVLSAITPGGTEIVVSSGGVPTSGGSRTYRIRLIDQATAIPRGSKLRVTFAASTAPTAASLLYLDLPMPDKASVRLGAASLTLPVLRTAISR